MTIFSPMTTFYSSTLLNGTSCFQPYTEGDALAYDARTVLQVEADSMVGALNRIFAIGNRQGRDAFGREWSSDIRSISVGDVIHIATINELRITNHAAYAVEPVGFRRLDSIPSPRFGETALVELGVARPAGVTP